MNPDIQVIEACKRKNERAYYALFSCCYSTMMGICMRYLGDQEEANGAVNRAFMKIVMNLDSWDESRPFEAWAKRITINTALDACRKKVTQSRNMPLAPLEQLDDSYGSVSYNGAESKLGVEMLEKLLGELPDMHRRVFNLYAIDGFTHAEVAETLECSVSASKWYLHQARKLLQERLELLLTEEKRLYHG